MRTTSGHAFIALTLIFFIVWIGNCQRAWESRGCTENSLALAVTQGQPTWSQFCMEDK